MSNRFQNSIARLILPDYEQFRQYQNDNITQTRQRGRNWTIPGVAERDLHRFDREKALSYAREFCDEFPIVVGLVQCLTDHIVGSGYRLSMQTDNKEWNKQVEILWQDACNKLDIRGIRTWGQLQRMWQYRKVIDGDVGIYLYSDGNSSLLQTIEADRIRRRKGDYLDQGIDFDELGRPLTYWIGKRPKDQLDMAAILGEGTPIDASDFILYAHYPSERADQLRGVSALLQNFNVMRDLAEIMSAYVAKVKNEGWIGLKFKTEPTADGTMFGPNVEKMATAEDGSTRRHIKMINGMNLHLIPGEDAEVLQSKTPQSGLMPFIRFCMRYAGTAFGMPLELWMLDVSETNWSGGRVLIELAKNRFRVEQDAMSAVSSRIFAWWLSREIKHWGLKPPKGLDRYWTHRWGRPSLPYLNPQQEIQAQALQLNNYLTTHEDILADRSDMDIEDIIEKTKHVHEMLREAGLPISTGLPGTNVQTNQMPTEPTATKQGE